MLRWKITATAALVAALALTGCAAGGGTGGDDATAASLTLGAVTAPTTLEASQAAWGDQAPFIQAVYDTLLLATPEGTIEPFLATEWSYNEDNTELRLTIRDDVDFTDGTHLTADIVKQNLERFKAGTSTDASYLANVSTVAAPDDTTVVLTLSAPDPALLNYLTRTAGLVASPAMFEDPDAATNPIGSGPYILDTAATVTGTTYVYTKNPDYWNPDLQHYDNLTISVLSDPTAALNAIKAGEVDTMRLLSNDALGEIEGAGWTVYGLETEFAGFLLLDRAGTMNPALGDVRVRQAINHAIDREGLLTALQGGLGTVTEQVFPTTSAAYDPALDETYDYDPDAAKMLLADAGYADGLTIQMPSNAVFGNTTYVLLEQQLADVGITVENVDVQLGNFAADLLAPKYAASYMTLEQNPDWQLIQFMLSPTALFNPFRYEDPQVNEWIQTIQFGDEAAQDDAVKELNAYVVDQAWFAPFYRAQNSFVANADTIVERVPTNVYPAIYDIQPAG
ncbi:peptide/nickel transport system substrate-binding protein [Microbacterium sp. cf046]|uniref:ABC transporter substrate-binding protein n=1 Tax=Microbacterium sp. cf046 TaxID=1761803 RepID=UPI0008F01F75|nr:ABC transporter substrate-binding protein [Microbacterium sp. cf046]SFS16820.1 peptide/nickel transport system substrate-binding protein [Microbacterium sp. cf046]